MNLFFFRSRRKEQTSIASDTNDVMEVVTYEPPHNTAEGGEFLDDAIRASDLTLTYMLQNGPVIED